MRKVIENFFGLRDLNTNIRTEVIAGLATFMAMAYIIFVNPAMISQTGMDFGAAGKFPGWFIYLPRFLC